MPIPTLSLGASQLNVAIAVPMVYVRLSRPQQFLQGNSFREHTNPTDALTTIDTVKQPLLPLIGRVSPSSKEPRLPIEAHLGGWPGGLQVAP